MSQFFTLLTKTGQGLLANAIAYGESLTIAELAIGDGGGKLPTPDASVTRLVNEVRRGPINQTSVDDANPNWTVVEQVLPADVGGWTIREVGLYDTDGNLIAYGNYPETYKPQLSEGSARTQTIRFVMEVTDTSAVTLRIDPSVVMASRQYVDDQLEDHAKSRNHPDADTKNKGLLRFATLTESRKGEESKAAQTPAGGMAQLDDHRQEESAHKAGKIALDGVLTVFGETVRNVWGVLAKLGNASLRNVGNAPENIATVEMTGSGAMSGIYVDNANDALSIPSGKFVTYGSQIGLPGGIEGIGYLDHHRASSTAVQRFVAKTADGVREFRRAYDQSAWSGWDEDYKAGSLPAASESAGGVAAVASDKDVEGETENSRFVTARTLAHWFRQTARRATESVFGLLRVATAAELESSDLDSVAVTPLKLRLGLEYYRSENGYLILPRWMGSLMFQWGRYDGGMSDGYRVSFLTAFPTSVFAVFLSEQASVNGTVDGVAWSALTRDGFFARESDGKVGVGYYFAIGRA